MEALLADLILVVHLAFVVFMVAGLLAVPIGGLFGWAWVREPWWRWAHVAGMGVVAVQALARVPCFLTIWEVELRRRSGAWVDERPFVVRLAHDLLFVEADQEVLWGAYVVLFACLLAGLVLVRPRRHPWWPASRNRSRGA